MSRILCRSRRFTRVPPEGGSTWTVSLELDWTSWCVGLRGSHVRVSQVSLTQVWLCLLPLHVRFHQTRVAAKEPVR